MVGVRIVPSVALTLYATALPSASAEVVTVDEDVKQLTENQSIYIPLGAVHRLYNPGKIMLELIEVQTGSYLGEDDIIRIVDDFGRG